MKAITIRQPWASLIAAGVKTIETRPRRTSYRGRIAVHAGATIPSGEPGPADRAVHDLAIPGDRLGRRICWCGWDAAECLREGLCAMPLGAVVASAVVTDCVPIVGPITIGEHARDERVVQVNADPGRGALIHRWVGGGEVERDVSDQLPFGDYSPGRWALLLDDIAPTIERCPWCWASDDAPTPCLLPDHYYDPDCSPCMWSDCPACGGDGDCPPVPARGQQAAPWEWTP